MGPAVRRLLPYLGRHRGQLTAGLACGVVTTAVSLLSPWILKHAIDDLTAGVTRAKLAWYAGLLLAVAVVGGVFRLLMRRIVIGASRHIEYDLRNDFYAHLSRMPLSYYHARRTGDLMSRATNDLNAVRTMVGPAVMYSSTTLLVFVAAIALMVSIDARLTAIALVPLPFVSIAVKVFGTAIHRRFEAIQAQLSDLSAVVQEALAGVRVVRAYGQEDAEIRRFEAANAEYVDRNRVLIRLQGMFYPSMSFFLGLGALLVLWLGSRDVILGRITVGELVAFNAYLVMLSWPMIAFGWVTNMLQRGMASWKRMLEVLDAAPAIQDDPRAAATAAAALPEGIRGRIELRNLTFSYAEGTPPVLDGISLAIEAGQTVAFVGATGSGKSTLLGLLPRLHEPPAGTVFIDGVDVRTMPLSMLRGAIGFVPQEPFLFSATVAQNIAFGAGEAASETMVPAGDAGTIQGTDVRPVPGVARAAAIARIDKDVAEFPQGYGTMVGERGITLSGGQKQRTALARALMVDPRILVLDDALSAVDTYTEEEILNGLRAFMRQRTSIIVSHRISTVREADRIFVLDRGRIVERGTHEELVVRGGLYANLYRKQLLEEELEAS
jgi:ATP-binding cassette subfamily B protein